MKQRLLHLLLLFVLFYFLIRLIQNMPEIINAPNGGIRRLPSLRTILQRLSAIVVLGLFPITAYYILLKLYQDRPVTAMMLVTICCTILFFLFFLAHSKSERLRYFFLFNLFYFMLYSLFGVMFFFVQFSAYKESQRKEMVAQNKQTELSFLRSQLNPHFLFNSLNNIYSLVYHKSDKSLEAISGFSELMRYMLYDANGNVPLSEEVNYIRKYIALQQLRFDYVLPVQLTVTGNNMNRMIPPLIMIPFVENAFKHGRFSSADDCLNISIDNTEHEFSFYCSNVISQVNKDKQGGIGLENICRRLALIYPSTHDLKIATEDNHYIVKLIVRNA
jgi:two-component system, LytTR family, sensor kinase